MLIRNIIKSSKTGPNVSISKTILKSLRNCLLSVIIIVEIMG